MRKLIKVIARAQVKMGKIRLVRKSRRLRKTGHLRKTFMLLMLTCSCTGNSSFASFRFGFIIAFRESQGLSLQIQLIIYIHHIIAIIKILNI